MSIGMLELWSWRDGALHKIAELPDTANHIAGTRAIDMAAVADFDGDGIADIASPSLDRTHLRIVTSRRSRARSPACRAGSAPNGLATQIVRPVCSARRWRRRGARK